MSDTPGTVARAMKIIRAVAEAPRPLGVKQIATITGLPTSTTHRLLDLLADGDFVKQIESTRKYGVGKDIFWIAHLVAARSPTTDFIQPVLDEITSETGETALFAVYVAGQRSAVYLAKSDSPNPLRFRIALNHRMDLTWGAAGLAILASLPEADQAEVISNALPSPVTGSPPDENGLRARLAAVRRDGYALSKGEELPGLVGIAVPASVPSGTISGSLALAIPEVRFDRKRIKKYFKSISVGAGRFSRFDMYPNERE